MPDPRNPEFEDFPDSAFLDPVSFAEAIQAQQEKEFANVDDDRGFFGIATLILAGIGGYAALKHFPPRRIGALAKEVKGILANPRRHGLKTNEVDKVRRAMSELPEVILKQPWAHVHRDKFGDVLGSIAAANDEDSIFQTLRTLTEIVGKNPKNFVDNVTAQRAIKTHLIRPIPQDASGFRTVRLGDLFAPDGGWQKELWHTEMPETLSDLQNVVKGLVNIPGLKGNQKKFVQQLVSGIDLDPGLYVRNRGAGNAIDLVNLRKFHPTNWIRGLQNAARNTKLGTSPFAMGIGLGAGTLMGYDENDAVSTMAGAATGLALGSIPLRHLARAGKWTTELLVPTELFAKGPSAALLGKGAIREFTGKELTDATGALMVHGNLFPVFGKETPSLGTAIASGLRLGRKDSLMGSAAAARKQEIYITESLAKQGKTRAQDYIERQEAAGKVISPIKRMLINLGDTIGIGPQYRRGSLAGDISEVPIDSIPETVGEALIDPAKAGRRLVGQLGELLSGAKGSQTGAAEYYAYRKLQGLKDWTNYYMMRVGRLFEQTTTLGFKPGIGPGQSAKRWLGLGIGVFAGIESLRYADYHMRRMTGTGPISAPLQAYTAVSNTTQHLLAATGIQQTSAYLENLMPGLINSPLSMALRTVAVNRFFRGMAPVGGKFGKSLAEKFALGAGFAKPLASGGLKTTVLGHAAASTAAMLQLTDITETPAHRAAVYRGEVEVPVREGRFWSLATLPFTGGRVTHTRPHLIPSILSHAREIGTYGSEAGYWQSQLGLPVPEAWFGLRPLLFPYEPEQRAVEQGRPVAATGPFPGLAGNIPFIAPTVNATIGEIIKPTQYWHGEQWAGEQLQSSAAALGINPIQGQPSLTDPTSLISSLQKQIDILRDFIGMPGFLVGAIKNKITGEADFYAPKRELETFGQATGFERAYYDMQLGGVAGMSELWRRILPHRRRETQLVNPVMKNQFPWLPGRGSVFPQDREFFRDFSVGDIYTKVRSGEARLPGPGYEAMHRLHSGIPGVYDAYDRWKILRDVAPTSQAFRHYDSIVKGWAKTASMRKKYPNPLLGTPGSRSLSGVVKAVVDGDTVVIDSSGEMINVRIAGGNAPELAHDRFEASMPGSIGGELARRRLENAILNKPVEINPIDIDVYGRIVADVDTLGIGRRDISKDLEEAFPSYNLSENELGQIFSAREYLQKRFEPYPFSERIFKDPLASVPRNMRDLTTRSLSGINAAIKREGEFTLPEKLVGNVWEQLSHINLPGPLNWPVNKLFPQRDALEIYRQRTLSGGYFANWETPFQSFALPWVNQTIGAFDKDYVPGRIKAQRAAMAQVDALEYKRQRMFASRALSMGNQSAAKEFKQNSMRTMAGTILSQNKRYARGSLSRLERGFYRPFSEERDPDRRRQILGTVSPQMGTMLKMSWGEDISAEVAAQKSLVESTQAPEGWAGWHPDVSSGVLKTKVSHDHAWDFHDMGLSQRENIITEEIFSDAFEIPSPQISFVNSTQARSILMTQRLGLSTHTINTVDSLFGPKVNMRISRDPRQYQHVLDNYGPRSQGIRF